MFDGILPVGGECVFFFMPVLEHRTSDTRYPVSHSHSNDIIIEVQAWYCIALHNGKYRPHYV